MTLYTDTWVTLAQANTYFATRLGASWWAPLTDAEKEALLVTAFNWLLYDGSFDLSPTTDSADVRIAQLEAAYFLHAYQPEYEQRSAAIAGGVTGVTSSKWSESYGSLQKPATVMAALARAGACSVGGELVTLEDLG